MRENAPECVARTMRFQVQHHRLIKDDRLREFVRGLGQWLSFATRPCGKRRGKSPQPHARVSSIVKCIGMIDRYRVRTDDGNNRRLQPVINGQIIVPRRQEQPETIGGDKYRQQHGDDDPPPWTAKPANSGCL